MVRFFSFKVGRSGSCGVGIFGKRVGAVRDSVGCGRVFICLVKTVVRVGFWVFFGRKRVVSSWIFLVRGGRVVS